MISDILKQISCIFTWFFTVAPWEQAVRVRFGKYVTLLGPGVYLRIPFVDRIFKQSIRMRRQHAPPQTVSTLDGKVVTCAFSIGFRIVDLLKLYNTIDSPNTTISSEVSNIVSDFISSNKLESLTVASMKEYVNRKLSLTKYGIEGEEFLLISFAHSRTYRVITGDCINFSYDNMIEYNEIMER